jgi:sugar phosphate isomerase/epimerase
MFIMNLGFVTHYSKETVEFAGKTGFDCLEVFTEPGTALDLNELTDEKLAGVLQVFEENNVKVGTVCCSVNHLTGDLKQREINNEFFIKALRMCKKFGTDIVTTNAWGDKGITPEENIPVFREVFSQYAKVAEQEGVKITIENCPHSVGYPVPVGNIAYSPEMWDALFTAVPSANLGLEFDPSHLYWLGIDYLRALSEFGSKVMAFHAKDTEILKEGMYKFGTLGKQIGKTSEWDAGWWRYRLPGWGMIDWLGIFRILYDLKYTGPVIIEHEDPVFDGDLRYDGLRMGYKYLRQFMI